MGMLKELPVPILAALFIAAYVATTNDLPIESRIFPYTVLVALALLGAVILLTEARLHRRKAPSAARAPAERSNVPLVLALSVAFVLAFQYLGFLAASTFYLLTTMVLLWRRPLASAAIAVGVSLGLYALFALLLNVPL